ncbi:hydroxymethylbilane synthase [Sanguibacter antarcticus]|uniref:Porphobilinogen deaminase n=1 Tax=Sanguibacter antarcticus TaxID=372484 RepID=A0A2A9E9S1_9MICO|nr:hydroxymethylbilane synthase [Sanguibacter antarcticus]PFG34960.1 hydroxymethylbilane synthase [Sanguibacter antarcticus]
MATTPALRIGTRSSPLALTQTRMVADRLRELTGRDIEIVPIKTDGDVLTGSLSQMGGTGVFVTALRDALLDGRCDVAVHSLKDLPTADVDGLTYVTPVREDPRDALCSRDGHRLADLPHGAKVGTGSPRRAAQLRLVRPDLEIVDIRGNVDTRLGRVAAASATTDAGDLDAVVLAAAGLNRMGRSAAITELIDMSVMAPAPGQGALAVECRTADLAPEDAETNLHAAFTELDDAGTHLAVAAERALLARLEAGCAAPVGTYARVVDDVLTLQVIVARPDGSEQLTHSAETEVTLNSRDEARRLGTDIADHLLTLGAADFV